MDGSSGSQGRSSPGAVRVGTSGWVYASWRGPFYPPGLRLKDRFAYYAERFDTAEINATFYRLPTQAAVAAWREAAPPGFVFAWKASRFITQAKKLLDVEAPLARVYASMNDLAEKLGPALFQLPPQLRLNLPRLRDFLALLPPERRHAVEFRHPSWFVEEVFDVLRGARVALCVSDHHDAPTPWLATADFIYVRGHGPGGRYHGSYDDATLGAWTDRLNDWSGAGRDAYVYFDNDIGCAAPTDALRLKEMLSSASTSATKRSPPGIGVVSP